MKNDFIFSLFKKFEKLIICHFGRSRNPVKMLSMDSIFRWNDYKIGVSLTSILFLMSFLLFSCGGGSNQKPLEQQTLTVYCDEGDYNIMKSPCMKFDSTYKELKLDLVKVKAFDAMSKLLSGDSKASIISRDFNHREDSLIKAFNVKTIVKLPLAHDALVLFVKYDFPLDTLADWQLREVLNSGSASLKKYYPKLPKEPVFYINNNLSSEYENLVKLITNGQKPSQNVKYLSSTDSIVKYITENPGDIGIGYLSQVIGSPDVKPLEISFKDSSGNYIAPHTVHQANIVQKFYPYIIHHYIYLFDERNDDANKLARFLSKTGVVQGYFNQIGIVPAYGEIKLVP